MRWLIGLLLVANIALLAWNVMGPVPGEHLSKGLRLKPDVGKIFLLDELPPPVLPLPKAVESVSAGTDEDKTVSLLDEREKEDASLAQARAATPVPALQQVSPAVSQMATEGQGVAGIAEEAQSNVQSLEPSNQRISVPRMVATQAESQPSTQEAPTLLVEPEPRIEREPPPLACGQVGPFKKRALARAWKKRHLSKVDSQIQLQPTPEIGGYWVVIDGFANREQAKAMMKRLRAAGFEDLWLFTKGERKNSISLGLFKKKTSAEKQLRRIRQKGFFAKISPLVKNRKAYWLTYRLEDDIQAQQEAIARAAQAGSLEYRKKNCD